jgi:hypothetical protein
MKNIKSDMKHVRKWSEGKAPFIVGLSLLIAGFANEYLELSKIHRKGKRLEGDIHYRNLKHGTIFIVMTKES